MRRPQGTMIITDPSAPVREIDTITCCHCQRIVPVTPGPVPDTGFCRSCMNHVCGPCADKGTCTPFEKAMEQAEAKARLLRSMGL